MRPQRFAFVGLITLVLLGVTLKWLFRGRYLEGWDSVDFALALREFDIQQYQPHFPGYPLYIALAKGCQAIAGSGGLSDVDALILPGVLLSGLAIVPVWLIAAGWAGGSGGNHAHESEGRCDWVAVSAGFTAAGLYLLGPGIWLQSEKPLSDSVGLAILAWVAWVAFRGMELRADSPSLTRLGFAAGLLLGLMLGARLSYWPFVIGAAFVMGLGRRDRGNAYLLSGIVGFSLGVAIWLIPLAFLTGPGALMHETVRFVTGHFNRWGGTLFTGGDMPHRLAVWWWDLWAFALGGVWPEAPENGWRAVFSLAFVALLIWTFAERSLRSYALAVIVMVGPYLLWIMVGQNPDRPRHVLPLALLLYPLAGIAAAGCVETRNAASLRWLPRLLAIIALLSSGCISVPLAKAYSKSVPPQVSVVQYVQENFDPRDTRIYTWETQRLFTYYAPEFIARRAAGLSRVEEDVKATEFLGTVLFTSKLSEKISTRYCFQYLTTFRRSRYLEPWFWTLSIFSYCGREEGFARSRSDDS